MRPYRGGGFTLVELVVVVFIMTLLASLIVPALAGQQRRRLDDAAEHMRQLINQAQQEAVFSSRVWQLVVDPGKHSYHFNKYINSQFTRVTSGPFAQLHPAPGVVFEKLVINGERRVSPGGVLFYPTGEQDSLRVTMQAGEETRTLSMGTVGPARVVLE